jgi:hypothetical protein
MTVRIAPDLGAWLVLRRVQWNGVALDPSVGMLYDHGQPLPGYLTTHVYQLADHGYVHLGAPIETMVPCRRVHMTAAGEALLDLLYDLRRDWLAGLRAGLPRRADDLDTLGRVLDGLRRLPCLPAAHR